ncbi:MAG: phytanoyl-CoA hydroxylase [Candidatus Eremiobacteraeota bacterium]|nr:phytanoyl-CoA hydroxylase [Candidatus Eremiobacteraeota bacterium]
MSVREDFERDGFVVLPGFTSPADVDAVRARAAELVRAFDPAESSAIFTTRDESTKSDAYFLTSGDKVRCFFEEEAFDDAGALRQPKELSINKIGHALHDLDPVFERFSHGPRLHALALELGLAEPRVYQSMYIFKQPRSAVRCAGTRTRRISTPTRSA